MFGVGYQEMFVILVIALVVFGPQRLPELAGQAGRWMREFKKMTSDLTGEFEKTIAEVDDIKKTVQREMKSMMDEVEGVADGVKNDLAGSTKSSAGAKSVAARSGATGKKTGLAALPKATKADPLIDVSLVEDDMRRGPVTRRVALIAPNGNGHVVAEVEEDALARVRRRRAAAGYARRA